MRKYLLTILLVSAPLWAASVLQPSGAYKLNRDSKLSRDLAVGQQLLDAGQFGVKAQWAYSASTPSRNVAGTHDMWDEEGNVVRLPANAVIYNCVVDVVTQPTVAPTLAIQTQGDSANIKSALPASSLTTGRKACTPDGTTGASIKLASEKKIQIVIASEAATAGKVNVWLQYVLSN